MENQIVRTHVVLKSGMGTVAIDDYDPKVHGPAIEENDDQYTARLAAKFDAVPKIVPRPNTTIAGLQTFDPNAVDLTPPAPAPRAGVPAMPPVGKPVATVDPSSPEQKQADANAETVKKATKKG